jgi:hypothetical protein
MLALAATTFAVNPAMAASFMIGDNDGYGAGICDNCDHNFDGAFANYDGRDASEMAATDGAQYTDTYSTTHPGFSPQAGTIATFLFSGLGSGWTVGHLEIDMADFQASTFGAVITTFNGIVQDFSYNDGFPHTLIHHYVLTQDVLDSINLTGELEIVIDRNASLDFYGFDYLQLNDFAAPTEVPEPASMALLGTGIAGYIAQRRRRARK